MVDIGVDLVIRGGTVITGDPERPVVNGDVHVRDGRIAGVGSADWPAAEVIDAHGMIVMPGMHDLHDHLRDLHPGLAVGEGLKLDELLRKLWRLNELAGPDEYRVGAALGTARLLKAGVTSVVDHIYPFHRPGLAEAAVSGYEQSGIRWFMARGIMTKGYDPICETPEAAFGAIRELADGPVPRDRLMIAPVSFRQTSADVYRESRRLADELGLRLYTHIAETSAEVETILGEQGARPVELLHNLGFAGPDTVMVHCVLLSPREIELLADSGTHVVHCPTNHMKLAKGVTPVPALLAAGVNVCLGADMMTDILAETRQEILLQGLANSDPSVVSARTALEMATVRGAAALGLPDVGRIAYGQRADIVCLDLRGIAAQPVIDPEWSVVHRGSGSDVVHVVADGHVVVRDRRLTRVDEEALIKEAQEIVGHYLRRAGVTGQEVLRH
ncbi:S-adenosylhomocysteine deaminase [Streptosporangium violaceochromogenes]|nr:S-adenosylhomocysteine deaminase [Streptosporangium violaceochromogenes]